MRRIAALHLPRLAHEIESFARTPDTHGQQVPTHDARQETRHADRAARDAGREEGGVKAALGRIAEVALSFGPTVAITLGEPPSARGQSLAPATGSVNDTGDTVWVDWTGCAHLFGGEEAAAFELASRITALGHTVHVAVADGPHLARAVARFAKTRETIVAPGDGARALAALPLEALPIEPTTRTWLGRLGIWTVGNLAKLVPGPTLARLGPQASHILSLTRGKDDTPLVPYQPPREVREAVEWDDFVSSTVALTFAARGLVAKMASRLEGRGEATDTLAIELGHDRALAQRARVSTSKTILLDLPTPLYRADDLFRVVKSKLDDTQLDVPIRSFALIATRLLHAPRTQLSLGPGGATVSSDRLGVLLAELSAELGPSRVGVLQAVESHRPEARSRLRSAIEVLRPKPTQRQLSLWGATASNLRGFWPTRLLPQPVRIGDSERHLVPRPLIAQGALWVVDHRLFRVEQVGHDMRLDGIEWWKGLSVSRDYFRVNLSGPGADCEAWVFFDRARKESFLHGWFD